MSQGSEGAGKILAFCDAIVAEVGGLPGELITWRPAPEVWSVMDILCHIEEFIPYWTRQTVGVVEHPERAWGRDHSDTARRAAVENTAARDLAEVEKNILDSARQAAATLGAMSDADFQVEAVSRNPRWGLKPAGFIVEHLLVIHLETHLGQIRRNAAHYPNDSVLG